MRGLKIRKIDNSLGVVIPNDILERMNVGEGSEVFFEETPDGALKITPYNTEMDLQMRALRIGAFKYNKALKALIK
ncbi:MAG: AbrB/MazE/SpoVT family DNA-binding domain-containing protein [Methyloligellaceae bacterium]